MFWVCPVNTWTPRLLTLNPISLNKIISRARLETMPSFSMNVSPDTEGCMLSGRPNLLRAVRPHQPWWCMLRVRVQNNFHQLAINCTKEVNISVPLIRWGEKSYEKYCYNNKLAGNKLYFLINILPISTTFKIGKQMVLTSERNIPKMFVLKFFLLKYTQMK